ncbi:hypothetical protein ABV409_09130 [Flagellimonas sp. DF-77]|uniref:hypothetical protein n=1 Tax=Flagellimonas algarum TaxID=3230298 RepID=UPI003390A819
MKTNIIHTTTTKTTYLERKRRVILDMGYGFIAFRSRTKKSLKTLKKQIGYLTS